MDTSNPVAIEAVPSGQALSPIKRQRRSLDLKRQIVEETLAPGASVARVARAHGVNANQVFAWRRRYQRGLLTAAKRGKPSLLAVRVAEAGARAGDVQSQATRTVSGMIQVELPKGKLRVTGYVDGEALRVVLEALRG